MARRSVARLVTACVTAVLPLRGHAQSPDAKPDNGPGVGVGVTRRADGLTIQAAPGSRYRIVSPDTPAHAGVVRLDDGALLLEFSPPAPGRTYQILTPHAIAAVRGTRWAVDVSPRQTSVLVLDGSVIVARLGEPTGVVLEPGLGVDVIPDHLPLTTKRWGEARVRALMARFGR